MKYIEVSKKIELAGDTSREQLKQAFIERLRLCFEIGGLVEDEAGFKIIGTDGSGLFGRGAQIDLKVRILKNRNQARILVHGTSKISQSLFMRYTLLFFAVLVVGLLPGSIETGGENSSALDTLVLAVLGIFLFYDISRKIEQPRDYLTALLESLDVEFG